MFLGIRKIGKDKHKFKAKITLLKVSNESTQKGVCFLVVIQRGSHQISAISEPCKKGVGRFSSQQYMIPMTLFCDSSQNQIKYLEKQATIKIFESDEKGNQKRRIGKKDMDWSEYANKGTLKMQIQLDPQRKTDNPKLTIQLFLQRQDDDSKSVNTFSSNNDLKNDRNLDEQIKVNVKQKNKNDQGQNRQFSKDKTLLHPTKRQRLNSEDDISSNKIKPSLSLKIKKSDQQKRKLSDQVMNGISSPGITPFPKGVNFAEKKKSIQQQMEVPSNNYQMKDLIRDVKDQQYNIGSKKQISQQKSDKQTSPSNYRQKIQTEFNDGQSPELQAFLLKKALKQKQTEVLSLKRQNDAFKKTVDKLIEEASSIKQAQKKTVIDKQSQQMRKAIVSRDITIDQLTTANKTLTARQDEYQKTIMKLRQDLISSKQKVGDLKYRQAFLMQSLFELGDKQALQQASRFLSI